MSEVVFTMWSPAKWRLQLAQVRPKLDELLRSPRGTVLGELFSLGWELSAATTVEERAPWSPTSGDVNVQRYVAVPFGMPPEVREIE